MYQQRHIRIRLDARRLARSRVRCHDNHRRVVVRRRREVRVIHEGDVRHIVGAGGEMKLPAVSDAARAGRAGKREGLTYESRILQTLDHLGRQRGRRLLVNVALRGLVVERDLVHGCGVEHVDRGRDGCLVGAGSEGAGSQGGVVVVTMWCCHGGEVG